MENMVGRTLSVHMEHEFLMKLELAGIDKELAQRVIDSKGNSLAIEVVRLIRNGGFEPTTSQESAHEIMGKNFFGIEEAVRHFGVNPTQEQLGTLAEIPFSEAVLRETKSTHILVAVFPMSIIDIRTKARKLFYQQKDAWWDDEAFANEQGEAGWKLVRKTPVDNSTSKNWQEQQTLIATEEEVPTAQVMVYTIIGHYLSMGERLFENTYVRTSCVDSDGCRVIVGCFGSDGLSIRSNGGDYRYYNLGVASARKLV